MLNDDDRAKDEFAGESEAILKKRKKLSQHFQKLDGKITDQSLTRVKMNILRSLERQSFQRTLLKNKEIHLSSSVELSDQVRLVIDKITRTKNKL